MKKWNILLLLSNQKIEHQPQVLDLKSVFCHWHFSSLLILNKAWRQFLVSSLKGSGKRCSDTRTSQYRLHSTFHCSWPQKSLSPCSTCVYLSVTEYVSCVLHGHAGERVRRVVWDELCEESGMEPCQSGWNWNHRHVKQAHTTNLNLWTQLNWE